MSDLTAAVTTVLSKPAIANKYDNAAHKLATWAAKMLDETIITEGWLKSVGFADDLGDLEIRQDQGDSVTALQLDNRGRWRVGGGSRNHQSLATRGQLRMLCQALGIELKEQA